MSYSDGIIYPPVRLQANSGDVELAVGQTSGDLGTCITYGSINKWSKYKPIVRAATDTVTGQWDYTNDRWLPSANWWKGSDGHCGLTFSVFSELGTLSNSNSFLYKLYNLQLPWTYTKPSGGASSPYRHTDFALYDSNAIPCVGQLAGAGRTIYVPASGQGTRTLVLNYDSPSSGDTNLTLSDFAHGGTSFTQFYLAVLMVKGNRYIVVSSNTHIGSTGSALIETEVGYDDVGTWQIIPFLSSVIITATGGFQTGTYISAGYDQRDTITLASSGGVYQIYAEGVWSNTSYTQIGIQVTVHNHDSAARTFNGGLMVFIYEADPSATSGDAGTNVAQYTYSTTFTVNANSSYTIPATLYNQLLDDYFVAYMNVTRDQDYEYWVTARFVDGTSIDNEWETVQDLLMSE